MKRFWICATFALISAVTPLTAAADWAPAGNALCTAPGWQGDQVTLALPNHYFPGPPTHSLFMLWSDLRNAPTSSDLYFNSISPYGNVFAPNGSIVVGAPGFQGSADASMTGLFGSDFIGNFGFRVAWADNRNGPLDVYAQALPEISGYAPAWTAGGVPVCTAAGIQSNVRVVGDLDAGATVAWIDQRDGGHAIYAQRLDASGVAQWAANGIPIADAPGYRSELEMIGTGDGGAWLAWNHSQAHGYQVVLQRITPAGVPADGWPEGGMPVAPSLVHQDIARMIPDGTGGVYVVWMEGVPRAVRIDATGVVAAGWPEAGVPLAQTPTYRSMSDAMPYQGGLVALWEQDDVPDDVIVTDLYAQRLDGSGARPAGWGVDGAPVCTEEGSQAQARLTPQIDTIVATWTDYREEDVYGMRLQDDGTPHPAWTPGGVAIAAGPGRQHVPSAVGNGHSLVMVAWVDEPGFNASEPDLLVRAVDLDGNIVVGNVGAPGPGPARLDLAPPRPNPAHTEVALDIGLEDDAVARLDILDTGGRRIRSFRVAGGPGRQAARWDLTDATGRRVAAGVYFARVRSAAGERARPVVVAD